MAVVAVVVVQQRAAAISKAASAVMMKFGSKIKTVLARHAYRLCVCTFVFSTHMYMYAERYAYTPW